MTAPARNPNIPPAAEPNPRVRTRRCRCAQLIAIAGLIAAVATGCISQKELDREFRANRERAYRQLVQARQDPNAAAWQEIEAIEGHLTLENALDLAMLHNKEIQVAEAQLLEARGQITSAVSNALPTASLSASALRNDNQGFITQDETYVVGVSVRQPLYLGGLVGAALDAAETFMYLTGQQLRQTAQDVERQVRRQYVEALLARALVAVSEQALADARQSLDDTETRLEYGAGTRFDVLRARVRVDGLQAELIQRRNAAAVAVRRLLNTIGVSQISDVTLAGELIYDPITVEDEALLAQALRRRPDLLIGEAQVRLARDNIKAEQAGDRPRVYLQGLYQESYPGFAASFSSFAAGGPDDGGDPVEPAAQAQQDGDDNGSSDNGLGAFSLDEEWERTANVGVVMEWPFFDGFRTAGRVTQAKAALRRQEVILRQAEQQVQFEVEQARVGLESSRAFVLSQAGTVETAEESLRLARVRYREGAGTSLDVISAETALAEARSDYNVAVRDHEVAKLELAWAVGIMGEADLDTIGLDSPDAGDGGGGGDRGDGVDGGF